MADLKKLKEQIERIDHLIDEAERRLGAHSVKPVLMQEFLDLEEKRESLIEKIRRLQDRSTKGAS